MGMHLQKDAETERSDGTTRGPMRPVGKLISIEKKRGDEKAEMFRRRGSRGGGRLYSTEAQKTKDRSTKGHTQY